MHFFLLVASASWAPSLSPPHVARPRAAASLKFGDDYYSGWDTWADAYPEADRTAYPALFLLPDDCYEVKLTKPLGIGFEEGPASGDDGVVVDFLVEGGNAEACGKIKPGDVLLATSACMGRDGTFERKLIPSRYLDFDTIMAAIGSNEMRFSKTRTNDVILQFARPSAPYENDGDPYTPSGKRGVTDYLKSLEFPIDSPWRAPRNM